MLLGAQGAVMEGWAVADSGDYAAGIQIMKKALEEIDTAGSKVRKPYFLSLMGDLYMSNGHLKEAQDALGEARETLETTGELTYELELTRLEGVLHCALGLSTEGMAILAETLDKARGRGAAAVVLRVAISMAQVLKAQGEPNRALTLLRPALEAVAQGQETRDLRTAKELLADLPK